MAFQEIHSFLEVTNSEWPACVLLREPVGQFPTLLAGLAGR